MKNESIQRRIDELQAELNTFPEGKLVCSLNKNKYKWYVSDGHEKTYIPRSKRFLAEQMAKKKYLTYLLEDLKQEQQAINAYLKKQNDNQSKVERLLMTDYGCMELLGEHFSPRSEILKDWMNSAYERNTHYPEKLTVQTSFGTYVRSKSEAMISSILKAYQIPFRYECILKLGGNTVYPDFTIRHPLNGNTLYWEHFGLMDDFEYAKKAYSKLQLYNSFGIIPSIHLITTYETKDNPLSMETIENIVKHYFV